MSYEKKYKINAKNIMKKIIKTKYKLMIKSKKARRPKWWQCGGLYCSRERVKLKIKGLPKGVYYTKIMKYKKS